MNRDTREKCGCETIELANHWWTHRCKEHREPFGFGQVDVITPMGDDDDESELSE